MSNTIIILYNTKYLSLIVHTVSIYYSLIIAHPVYFRANEDLTLVTLSRWLCSEWYETLVF